MPGRKNDANGYVRVYLPKPDQRWVLEHRHVMAEHLGRPLTDAEEVHHINRVKHDNRVENLKVVTVVQHRLAHSVRHDECEQCGDPFFAHSTAVFCSPGCKQRAWRIRNDIRDTRKRAREDPLKKQARNVLSAAVRRGRVARQPCEVCGSDVTQAHHVDYGEPLKVRWLCRRHHEVAHGRSARPVLTV